jgi:hypothetical protein
MDADKRYYRVPINDKTNTVWKTLDAAYGSIYR